MTKSELNSFCMELKGTTKDIKWGNDLCYCVGEKMYCVTTLDGPASLSFKTSEEDFAILTERQGIIPAPYVARYHWVYVENTSVFKPKELREYIRNSYKMVFEKLPGKVKKRIQLS